METKRTALDLRVGKRALDQIPLAMVKISTDRQLTYVNQAAVDLAGPQLKVGAYLSDLALDKASRERLGRELGTRFKRHGGSSYSVTLARQDIGTKVTLEVSAVPEYDTAGELQGSVGFVTDRSIDNANAAIHRAIESASGWDPLLRSVARELHEVIEFDSFLVVMISKKGNHLRSFLEDPVDDVVSPIRWWPMQPFIKTMVKEMAVSSTSVKEMFADPPMKKLLKKDSETKYWYGKGYKHLLRRPIERGGRRVAFAILQRKTDRSFSRVDIERFEQLPVSEAVNMALTLDSQGEMQFALDLIRDLGQAADSVDEVAARLVGRLRENYSWEHVSMIRVDADREELRLLCQSHDKGCGLPGDHVQSFKEGLLGKVARKRKAVNVGDVSEQKDYIVGMKNTCSEMCLPVPGATLRWILNVESKKKDAFADEEQQGVELLLLQAGLILDRAAMVELKNAVLKSITDAVVQTDVSGRIQEANPAAVAMFGTKGGLRGRSLSEFVHPAHEEVEHAMLWKSIVEPTVVAAQEVRIVSVEGKEKPVLLSGAALPENFGGKVFVASDLTGQKRAAEYEKLKQIFRQVADETRLPLGLASTFLGEILEGQQDAASLADKALAQIRKADLPLERLVRLATASEDAKLPTVVVDVAEVVGELVNQLPRSDAKHVKVALSDRRVLAKAARPELAFCLQSLLAFLLKHKAQDDDINVEIAETRKQTVVDLGLSRKPGSGAGQTRIETGDETLRQFALAEPTIKELMQRMKGDFRPWQEEDATCRLIIQPGGMPS